MAAQGDTVSELEDNSEDEDAVPLSRRAPAGGVSGAKRKATAVVVPGKVRPARALRACPVGLCRGCALLCRAQRLHVLFTTPLNFIVKVCDFLQHATLPA
jgi:hypothetical protein